MTRVSNLNFSDSDFVLNYRPRIEFVEPPQESNDEQEFPLDTPADIEQAKTEVEEVIKGYQAVSALAKLAQDRIDSLVKANGGVEGRLDPIKDFSVIAAIKRQFPEEDGTRITFDMYKEVLRKMNALAPQVPTVQRSDMLDATKDPLRTGFGGYETKTGDNRPELAAVEVVKPVNMAQFESAQKANLIKMILEVTD